jgi:hypothetical protein
MAISDPVGRAHAVRTPLQAARLMARLEHEISEDHTASQEWHEHADEAIDQLRRRFPTARRLDAYMNPPLSSPAARAGLRQPPSHDHELPREPRGWAHGLPTHRSRHRRPDAPGSARRGRGVRHTLEAAGVLATLAAAVALLVRHARRHPRHALAGGVVLVAIATGRPHLVVTAGTVAAMVLIWRRRPGARPRVPRAPKIPSASLRMPARPRWPR